MYTGHKLTLINIQCRCKRITQFVQLPTYNGKAVLHQSTKEKSKTKKNSFVLVATTFRVV